MDKRKEFEDDDNMSIEQLRSQIINLRNTLSYMEIKLLKLEEIEKEKNKEYTGKCFSFNEYLDDEKSVFFVKKILDNGDLLCDSISIDNGHVEFCTSRLLKEDFNSPYYIEITLEEYNKVFDEAIEVAKRMRH